MTFILGLTGSIGMGKSATAGLFREAGVPVHDADACVHALYAPGGAAVGPVGTLFPGIVDAAGGVDRVRLRAAVLGDDAALGRLEAAVHPLVRAAEQTFLAGVADRPLAVLDVPLLYETGGERRCDAVAVVTAPEAVQRARVLARPGMTQAALDAILAKQLPDAEKRRRADFLVDASRGFENARAQVASIVSAILGGWTRAPRDRTP